MKHQQTSAWGCDGKSGYDTWALANSVVQRNRRSYRNVTRQQVYRCSICGNWHIGRGENVRSKKEELRDD